MNNFTWAIVGLVISLVFVVLAFTSSKIKEGKKGALIARLKDMLTQPLLIGLAVVISVGIVVYWGLHAPMIPRPSDVGSWSWHHWLPLLILWGIFAALVAMYAKKEWAGTLQKVLVGVMLVLFVVLPVLGWVIESSVPHIVCPDVSAHETRDCVLNRAWSTWIKAAEGPADDGMQMCFTPGGKFERRDTDGTTFFRFKADSGHLVKAYRLIPGNKQCPEVLP
ncbi:MAG: hypothetical protein ACYCPH_03130 [Minisyncoccota bacterium]